MNKVRCKAGVSHLSDQSLDLLSFDSRARFFVDDPGRRRADLFSRRPSDSFPSRAQIAGGFLIAVGG